MNFEVYYQRMSARLRELSENIKTPELPRLEQLKLSREAAQLLEDYAQEVRNSGKRLNAEVFLEYREKVNAFIELRKAQYDHFFETQKFTLQERFAEHRLSLPASPKLPRFLPWTEEEEDPKIISIFTVLPPSANEGEADEDMILLEQPPHFKQALEDFITQFENRFKESKQTEKRQDPKVIPITHKPAKGK